LCPFRLRIGDTYSMALPHDDKREKPPPILYARKRFGSPEMNRGLPSHAKVGAARAFRSAGPLRASLRRIRHGKLNGANRLTRFPAKYTGEIHDRAIIMASLTQFSSILVLSSVCSICPFFRMALWCKFMSSNHSRSFPTFLEPNCNRQLLKKSTK